jgi:hypothetical protein
MRITIRKRMKSMRKIKSRTQHTPEGNGKHGLRDRCRFFDIAREGKSTD